jgi:hypothetical protein
VVLLLCAPSSSASSSGTTSYALLLQRLEDFINPVFHHRLPAVVLLPKFSALLVAVDEVRGARLVVAVQVVAF